MARLSKLKLNELKQSKNYTLFDIANKTGIPKSTIDKIFGGFNKNPSIDSLLKIAQVLGCGIDDFFDYDIELTSPYSIDRTLNSLYGYLYDNSELRKLLDSAKDLSTQDILLLQKFAIRLKK